MSETVLRVLLSELGMVRVRCKTCATGVALEIPLEQLGSMYASRLCPFCKAPVVPILPEYQNYFELLSQAVVGLKQIEAKISVELVIPEKAKP